MANDLRAFMANNIEKDELTEIVVTKRIKVKGEPVKWKIRTLTSFEDERIRKECTRKVPVQGKRNQRVPETDINEYIGKMVAACVVYPDLNDAELQNSYGVMSASDLLKTMLKPGEYSELTTKVQEINGFDVTMEELVDEAKN